MKWLKDALVDMITTLIIMASVFMESQGLKIAIIIYTVLILLARVFVLFGDLGTSVRKKTLSKVPNAFYHLIYALNVVFLLVNQWWLVSLAWVAIWLMSWWSFRQLQSTR